MGTSQNNTPNFLKVTQMVANMTLAMLENNMVMLPLVNRSFDADFGKKGMKIGDSEDIRLPLQFQGSRGPNLNIEGMQAPTVPVKISTQYVVGMEYSSYEQLLSLDFLQERAVEPAKLTISNAIDSDLLSLANQFPGVAGVPGSGSYARSVISQAVQTLDNNAVPKKGVQRNMIVNSATEQGFKNQNATLFNKQSNIAQQFDTGRMTEQDGFMWDMDQNVAGFTTGLHGGTPVVNGANQTGGNLVVNGFPAAVNLVIKQGEVFTAAGCYNVNPINNATGSKTVLSDLKQWVVTSDVYSDGSGNATIPFVGAGPSADTGIVTNGAYQNCSASPTNGGAITFLTGGVSQTSAQNFFFTKDAITYVGAKLPDVNGEGAACSFAFSKKLNIEIRVSTQWNILTDIKVMRIETLGGVNVLRRSLGGRLLV